MKKFFFCVFCFLFSVSGVAIAGGGGGYIPTGEFLQARTLADMGIIVSQEDPTLYRLSDTMSRQELIGTALKLADVWLPLDYECKGYYSDAYFAYGNSDFWVCRAFELGADHTFVTRANLRARPKDAVTRAEALAMIVKAGDVDQVPGNYSGNWLHERGYTDWQTKLLTTLPDCRIFNHGNSCEDGADFNTAVGSFRPNDRATRQDVFEFAYYTDRVQQKVQEICENLFAQYADGDIETSVLSYEEISARCPENR